jgi:hypothetical protein
MSIPARRPDLTSCLDIASPHVRTAEQLTEEEVVEPALLRRSLPEALQQTLG